MNLRTASPLAALFLSLTLGCMAGCSGDPEPANNASSCAQDSECKAGNYCSQGACMQDCDATQAGGSSCEVGQSCTPQGRCVDSAVSCSIASDCDQPPQEVIECDGGTSVKRAATGRCIEVAAGEGKMCRYDDLREPCALGCNMETGLCNPLPPDPCEGISCEMPPQDSCKDADTLVRYSAQGSCNEGACGYDSSESMCPNGCEDAACKPGICEEDTCDAAQPPAPTCSAQNPDVLITQAGQAECVEEQGSPICTFASTEQNCAYVGGACTSGACVGEVMQTGQLVVTEYMVNPQGSGQTALTAQWIEVTNITDDALDLNGWTLRYTSKDGQVMASHTIDNRDEAMLSEPLMIASGASLVLANGPDPFFDGTNAPDYQYADVVMGFAGALEVINASAEVSDYLYWESGATIRAHARQLDPDVPITAQNNDTLEAWCPNLTSSFGLTMQNFGTPGADNTACSAAPCDVFACGEQPEAYCSGSSAVVFTQAAPMCQTSRFGNPFCDFEPVTTACDAGTTLCVEGACEPIPANLPAPGEVIFTEFMGDPVGSDSEREWLELYNTTDNDLSLFSLFIEDNEQGSSLTRKQIKLPAAMIPAKSYVVFVANQDAALNGNITGGYALPTGLLKNSPALNAQDVSTMTIRLVRADGALVDEAHYAKPAEGKAQQLDLGKLDATLNDDAASYCLATMTYADGFGDGSPGAANEICEMP